MYRKFFGITDYPFNDNPDPHYFCNTPEVDAAFNSVMLGVRERRGLILLTGEVGTGKTTLLKTLLERLDKNLYRTAFVFNPRLNTLQLLDFMLTDFGIEHEMADKGMMLARLKRWLLDWSGRGGTAVLVIDEAQNLSPPVLEEVRLLNNLETPVEKLLQIVVSGQPELEAMILRPEFRALRLRIAHWAKTRALSLEETNVYIAFRLRVAGGNIKDVFTPECVAYIHRFSRGIPRLINLLCAHSMVSAYAEEKKPVPPSIVQNLASQFELNLNTLLYRPLPAPLGTEEDTEGPARAVPEASRSEPLQVRAAAPTAAGPPLAESGAAAMAKPSLPPGAAKPLQRPPASGTTPVAPPAGPAPPNSPARAGVGEKTPAPTAIGVEPRATVKGPPPPASADGSLQPQPMPTRGPRSLNIIRPAPRPLARRLARPAWVAGVLLAAGLSLVGYYLLHRGGSVRQLSETSGQTHPPLDSHNPADLESTPSSQSATASPLAPTSEPPHPGKNAPVATRIPPKPGVGPLSARLSNNKPLAAELNPVARPAATPTAKSPTAELGVLEVTASPDGAAISIDGHTDPTWITPHTFGHLPPGSYTLVLTKTGYRRNEQKVEVMADRTVAVAGVLSPESGVVSLLTTPPGAEVGIDGKPYGASPVRAALPPGQHTYTVSQAGFEPLAGTLTLNDQDTVTKILELSPVQPKPSPPNLQLTTTPAGATVYLDGAPLSEHTPASLRITAGDHTLIFVLAGYRAARKEVSVPADGTLAVDQILFPQ